MRSFVFKCLFASVLSFFAISAQAQNLKLDEIITCFAAPKYPDCVFEMVENKGFIRIDKQWLPKCDRVIYYFSKEGKPAIFVNPMNCYKPQTNTHYPMPFKNELELQFQKRSRSEFEALRAQVKKQCKFLSKQNDSDTGKKGAGSTTSAYRHEATGITLVIEDSGLVAFIYLIK